MTRMLAAELRVVFGRRSGQAALALALALGVLAAATLHILRQSTVDAQVNGLPVQSMVDLSWRGVASWGLRARNFFALPTLLVFATAASLAGEIGDHTLRELLVRPVPRWKVLAVRLFALAILSAATLLATLVPALAGGAAIFGTEADIGPVLLGYLASWASDLGLIALAAAVAVFVRGVAGVVVLVVLALLADLVARGALTVAAGLGVDGAETVRALLPGSSLACWEGWASGWDPAAFAGLALLLAAGLAVAFARFQRMDVP